MIPTADPKANTKLDRLLSDLDQIGWKSGSTDDSLGGLCEVSLRGDSYVLAAIAGEIACDLQPITLRGLLYRVVSTSFFPSTDDRYYKKLGNLMSTLRRSGWIPYEWIVDNIRSTIKSSSWSGLTRLHRDGKGRLPKRLLVVTSSLRPHLRGKGRNDWRDRACDEGTGCRTVSRSRLRQ